MKTMEYNKTNYEPKDYTASTVTNATHNTQNDFNSLVEKYMLLDKKTLAELLALKEFQEQPQYPTYPTYPYVPSQGPWVTYCAHCTDPFHDCVNCPHHTTGWSTVNTTNIKYATNTTADVR